jgi:hypothetical protein
VEDVVCINPGSYMKGASLGTFAEIFIHPLSLIDTSEMTAVPNLLEARARVDIMQFSH